MTITAPPDIDADIAQRHRRGQSIDQLVKVGGRTGWWTEADVDRVLTQAEEQTSARLEELEEELTDREVLAPSGHITDVLVHQEAAASVALDGETQVIGGAYTATGPRSVPDCVVELAPDTEVFDQQLAEAKATLPSPDQDDPAPESGGLGASDAPAGPPAADVEAHADRPLADWELELLAPIVSPDDWVWDEAAKCYELRSEQTTPEPASDQVEKFRNTRPVDVLAVGLAHTDPAVRAKARRVQRAVDQLVAALSGGRA